MRIESWTVREIAQPMVLAQRDQTPGAGEVLIEIAGCGVCHTDLGFFYDGVPTRHPLPLTLGHEISGRVVEAGQGAQAWVQREVVSVGSAAHASLARVRSAPSRSSRATMSTAASLHTSAFPRRDSARFPT